MKDKEELLNCYSNKEEEEKDKMDPYPKIRCELLLKPGCLQYKDKDKGRKA